MHVNQPQALSLSTIPMIGTLRVVVRDAKTRKIRRRVTIKNKITYLAADVLVELIAQRASDPVAARQRIYSMRMGSSNTAASRSDTNLGTFVVGVQLLDVNKITGAPGELQFVATLEAADGNGNTLREAGLFTAGAAPSVSDTPNTTAGSTRLFARQTHPDIPKSSAIVLDYSWTIAFVAP
jgi:hypothetical protein